MRIDCSTRTQVPRRHMCACQVADVSCRSRFGTMRLLHLRLLCPRILLAVLIECPCMEPLQCKTPQEPQTHIVSVIVNRHITLSNVHVIWFVLRSVLLYLRVSCVSASKLSASGVITSDNNDRVASLENVRTYLVRFPQRCYRRISATLAPTLQQPHKAKTSQ